MRFRRGKTIAEAFAEQQEAEKKIAEQQEEQKILKARQKKKIAELRKRLAEENKKRGLPIKEAEIR